MKAELKTITPEMANYLLLYNMNNRNIQPKRVNTLCAAIKRGEWQVNGETIKVAKDGTIIDGQHRLTAISKCGRSVQSFIIEGLDYEVFKTIDTGKSRTSSDVLKMSGVKYSNQIASAIIKYKLLLNGFVAKGSSFIVSETNSSIEHEYSDNSEIYDELAVSASVFYHKVHKCISIAEYIGYSRFFQTKYSIDVVYSFWETVVNRSGVGGMLYDRLINDKVSLRKMPPIIRGEHILKSFKLFIDKKVPSKLVVRREQTRTEI